MDLMIIFTILKIIGLIILVLLCILLALILLILFVPIRYQAGAEKGECIRADAQVSWMLRLIRAAAVYDQTSKASPLHLQLKVAGFKLYDNQKQESVSAKTAETEQHKTEASPEPEKPAVKTEDKKPQEAERPKTEPAKTEDKTENRKAERKEQTPPPPQPKRKTSGPGLSDRLDELQIKLERVSRKKEKLVCLFENDKNRLWLDKTLFRLKKLLLYLLPSLKRLRLHFGFDDPSVTGQLLGCLSICYPLCEDRMVLEPVFNGKVFDGDVRLTGNIRLYRFITFAVPTFLNPRFFKIFKKVRCIIKK